MKDTVDNVEIDDGCMRLRPIDLRVRAVWKHGRGNYRIETKMIKA